MSRFQYSERLRNTQLNCIPFVVGGSAVFEIRTGPRPIACDAPDEGTLLVAIELKYPWLQKASGGVVDAAGTWTGTATGTGTAAHFRLKDSAGVCHMQGSVTGPDGGGSVELEELGLEVGDAIAMQAFTVMAANE